MVPEPHPALHPRTALEASFPRTKHGKCIGKKELDFFKSTLALREQYAPHCADAEGDTCDLCFTSALKLKGVCPKRSRASLSAAAVPVV